MSGPEGVPNSIEWEEVPPPSTEGGPDPYVPLAEDLIEWEEVPLPEGAIYKKPEVPIPTAPEEPEKKEEEPILPGKTIIPEPTEEQFNQNRERLRGSVLRAKEYITAMNMPLLASVVNEYVARADQTADEKNERIASCELLVRRQYEDESRNTLGSWVPLKNGGRRMEIVAPNIFSSVTRQRFEATGHKVFDEDTERIFASQLLATICHEQVHARSDTPDEHNLIEQAKKIFSKVGGGKVKVSQGGYRQKGYEGGVKVFSHKLFDEGVTDLLGEEVFEKYITRSGDRAKYQDEKGNVSYGESYLSAKRFVRMFCEKLATAGGIPVEAVWGSVIEGYFNRRDMRYKTMQKMFGDVFDETFLKEMENASPKDIDRVKNMISRMEERKFTEEEVHLFTQTAKADQAQHI